MKIDGIQLSEGSSISNAVIASGTAFPGSPNTGELFFRSDSDPTIYGMYIYMDSAWERVDSALTSTTPSGSSLPSGGNVGDLFYLTAGSVGLYVYSGTAWAESSGGAGSVTSVSVTTANGVSGTVATATTTPAITLTLGAITPSSVAASGTVTGSNLSGTNTGDQTTITGNAGTATALQTARHINGTAFDGTADITVTAAAGTLTGSTLASGVTASSLTSVGTLTNLTVTNPISGSITGNAATATSASTATTAATATNVAYSGLTGTVPTWNQDTTGNAATATDATNVSTTAQDNNQQYALMLSNSMTSGFQSPTFDPDLQYNPHTDVLTVPGSVSSPYFTSTATTGSAPFSVSSTTQVTNLTAQFATTAEGVSVAATSTNAPFYPVLVAGSTGTQAVNVDTGFSLDPATGAMTVPGTITITSGTVTNLAAPSASSDAATKAYVDASISGASVHNAVEAATAAALTATYTAGSADNWGGTGVGATLTNSGTQVALTGGLIDGYTGLYVNARVLVKNQATGTQNGVYVVTNLGSGSTNWVLTRATDYNNSNPYSATGDGDVHAGAMVFVQEGTTQGATIWIQTSDGTGTNETTKIGTDAITMTQFAAPTSYLAGTGLNLAGNTFSNTGVLSITSNTGLSTNTSATGNVTITNTGVTSLVAGTNVSLSGSTGAVTVSVSGTVGAATTATNLAGTTQYSLPYQSASATTSYLSPGTANSVLQTNSTGSAPSWTNAPTISGANISGVLQTTGGTLTGTTTFSAPYLETGVAVTAASTTNINCSLGNEFLVTMGANITSLTFSNVPASGSVYSATLFLTQSGSGSFLVTWPGSVQWAGAVAPTLSLAAGLTDVVTLVTKDGGTTWQGFGPGAVAANTLTGTTLASNVVTSSLTTVGTLSALAVTGTTTQTGVLNLAGSSSALQLAGSAGTSGQILTSAGAGATPTWSAAPSSAASALTGTTLASNVVTSSLTSVGTLGSLAVTGTTTQTGALNLAGSSSPLQVGGSAGTSGYVLTSAGAGATPTWSAAGSAAAGSLTGTTLASNVINASLSSIQPAAGSTFSITGGSGTGPGQGQPVTITGGTGSTGYKGGNVSISAGAGGGSGNNGATVTISGSASTGTSDTGSGTVTISGGNSTGTTSTGAQVILQGGTGTSAGGALVFQTAATSSLTERLRITATGALAVNGAANYGTSGQVLVSGGNAAPSWSSAASGITSLGTLTSLTVNGNTDLSNGGTASNNLILGNGTGSTPATSGGAVIWGSGTGRPNIYGYNAGASSAIGFQINGAATAQFLVTNAGVTVNGVATQAGAFNLSGATSPLQAQGSAGTTGQVLASAGAGTTPTWGTLTLGSSALVPGTALTTVTGLTSVTSTGFTATGSGTTSGITLNGTVTNATDAATKSYVDTAVVSAASGPTVTVISGTTQAAVAGVHYILTATSGTTTLTLPASPTAGQMVWVANFTGRTDVVIAGNGSNIQALNQNLIMNQTSVDIELRYIDSTRGWIIL